MLSRHTSTFQSFSPSRLDPRRHSFRALCPPTGSCVWPQLLALIPCLLHHFIALLVLQAGRLHSRWRTLSCPYHFLLGLASRTGEEPQGLGSLMCTLSAFPKNVKAACVLPCFLTRGVCYACLGAMAGSSNARAVSLVRCDSSQFMSLCIGLLAIAGRLIALLCNSCMLSQLLLICDVESALSLCVSFLLRAGCARVLSCRAEYSRRLDDEVGGLIAHVGPCRCRRRWYVVLRAGAACAQALSCRAEFSPDGWTMKYAASLPMSGLVGEGGGHCRMMALCETAHMGSSVSGSCVAQ